MVTNIKVTFFERRDYMPVLSRFYGITIRMYFQQSEHNPPHFHAIYGDDMAAISIKDGKILEQVDYFA